MGDKKIIKIHNKSDKPDNIVFKENVLIERCIKVENKLPKFMKDYFIYLKGSIAIIGSAISSIQLNTVFHPS